MARIRTHNRRAKRPPYAVFARRRNHARKIVRHGLMYGMGAKKLADSFRELGEAVQRFGSVTGRMVSKEPAFQYQFPKIVPLSMKMTPGTGKVVLTNFAEQEARALTWHREALEKARERGDTVIEHTYADATIIPKGED